MGTSASSKPNAWTNAEDLLDGRDLTGKVYFITGGNAGLGLETARVLAKGGGTVVLSARSQEKANFARASILADVKCSEDNIKTCVMDLASLKSIEAGVKSFESLKLGRLDCLINNAGVMTIRTFRTTEDGFEKQWGTNHVGHQYLTTLLMPLLIASNPSRVVTLSSAGHYGAPTSFDPKRLPPKEKDYDPFKNYSISKISNVLMSLAVQEKYSKDGVTAYSLHPGVIDTNLGQNDGEGRVLFTRLIYGVFGICPALTSFFTTWNLNGVEMWRKKTVEQGASTTVMLSIFDPKELEGGAYYADCSIGKCQHPANTNRKLALQLWDVTAECIKKKI